MSDWQRILWAWEFDPSVAAGCLLLLIAYLVAVRGRFNRETFFFIAGVATLFFALVSPLDKLGDEDLFSAHMAQHLLLQMLAPLFIVLGIPRSMAEAMVHWRPADMAERILGAPPVAWAIGTVTLWIWHLPALYNATLADEGIHIFEHLTFIVTGTIFWWPVYAPLERRRMTPLGSVVYVTLGGTASALLGVIFTISSTPFYSGYDQPADSLGLLAVLRNRWGLTQVDDQQLGGSIMWVFGSLITFCVIIALVVRWYETPETEPE